MLSTTHYWSSIHVDKPGRAPARQASVIKTWLNRSGVHRPLFISIECPQMEMKRAQRFLGIFAPYTHRVKYLRFAGLAVNCNILLKEPFPILETLDLYHISKFFKDAYSTDNLAASWGEVSFRDGRASNDIHIPKNAFQLKRILLSRLDHNSNLSGFVSLIHLHARWENITRLEWVPIQSFSDIPLVFQRCSFLKECLCVTSLVSRFGNPPNTIIRHDHLQLLIIHLRNTFSEKLLGCVTLPQLTHLELHGQGPHFTRTVLNGFFQRSRSSEKLASLKIYYQFVVAIADVDGKFMWLAQALNRLTEFFVGFRREGVEYNLISEVVRDVINARLLV